MRNVPTVRLDVDGHCFWDFCVAETVIVVTAALATAAYLSTPSGQEALKAGAKLLDKTIDALAAGGNALAAGCAGSGTCLTGMKPPGGPPTYYQQDGTSESDKPKVPNPDGSKGAPDHQKKVDELVDKAKGEAHAGETVESNKQVKGVDSKRRPDAQIVDTKGKTRKVFEAERRPNSTRNKNREAEYKKLQLDNETHPLK